jgi:hypothetical protein
LTRPDGDAKYISHHVGTRPASGDGYINDKERYAAVLFKVHFVGATDRERLTLNLSFPFCARQGACLAGRWGNRGRNPGTARVRAVPPPTTIQSPAQRLRLSLSVSGRETAQRRAKTFHVLTFTA